MEGFARGFVGGGAELVSGTWDLVCEVWLQAGLGLVGLPAGLGLVDSAGESLSAQAEQLAEERLATTWEATTEVGALVGGLVMQWKERNEEIQIAILTGDSLKLAELNTEYAALFEMGGELFDQMHQSFAEEDSATQGEMFGRVIFELGAIVVPVAKAGQLSKLGKVAILQSVIGRIKAAAWFAKLDEGRKALLLGSLSRVQLFVARLMKTKMCFVAGTLVHTQCR